MDLNLAGYPLLLFFSAFLSLLFVFHLVSHPVRRENLLTIALLTASLAWSLGCFFEVGLAGSEQKILWHKVHLTGFTILPPLWFFFVFRFSSKGDRLSRRFLALLLFLPLAVILLAWGNEAHELVWNQPAVIRTVGQLHTLPGPAGWTGIMYGNLLTAVSVILLFRGISRSNGRALAQILLLILFSVVLWVLNTVDLIALFSPSLSGIVPNLIGVCGLLLTLGLAHYHLLMDLSFSPPGILNNLHDGILVINQSNRVVQINTGLEKILRKTAKEILYQPVEKALSDYPNLLDRCRQENDETHTKISLENQDGAFYYELLTTRLSSSSVQQAGRLIILHDITKQVNAEQSSSQSQSLLKQSEEKYRSLVENITDIIFTMDTQGVFTYISPVVEGYTGFHPDEITGRTYQNFIHVEDLPGIETHFNRILSGELDVVEFRLIDKSRNVRYVRSYIQPINSQNGQPTGLQGVLTDITEGKYVEEALERRASQLSVLNYIGEQIAAVIELDLVLDSATRLIQKHFGYYHVAIFLPESPSGMLAMRSISGAFAELFPKNHRLSVGQGIVGWAAENKSTLLANDVQMEPRYTNFFPEKVRTRAELAVPILVGPVLAGVLDIQSPLVNAFDDNDVRVLETVADQIAVAMENARLYEEVRLQLKERERKENMLRIQRDLLVHLSSARKLDETLRTAIKTLQTEFHTNEVSILLYDPDRQVLQPSLRLENQPGSQHSAFPNARYITHWVARNGQPLLIQNTDPGSGVEASAHEPLALLCVPLLMNQKVTGVVRLESSRTGLFLRDDLQLLANLANSLVIMIERARLFEEIETARAELERRAAELEEANASLRELDRLKSQFVANMSHELRTPLNSIIGFSEVMVDEITGVLNDEQKEYCQDILDSGKHLLALINDLLDFSKIEARRFSLEQHSIKVNVLFDEVRSTMAPLIEKKSQTLIFSPAHELPLLTADPLRIKQVFINLISNANKFTPEHGCIQVSCSQSDPEHLLFSFEDDGIGIRHEDQDLIFEEFRQVDGSMTRQAAGTGLGLAISKRIIEMHHGQIWVESEPGKGSNFCVMLPIHGLRES